MNSSIQNLIKIQNSKLEIRNSKLEIPLVFNQYSNIFIIYILTISISMNPQIKSIKARRVLDSRGWPTVEVEIRSDNHSEIAMVPSWASTGIHEALELRDKIDSENPYFMNKDVRSAINNVNDIIAPALIWEDLFAQKKIDKKILELDWTENKEKLWANAILAVSLAVSKLSAKERGIPLYKRFTEIAEYQLWEWKIKYPNCLPVPMVNVINGWAHANSNLAIQEFMIMPFGETYQESLAMASDLFHTLQKKVKEGWKSTAVWDEGGIALFIDEFTPSTNAVFDLLIDVIETCWLTWKVKLAIDAAASEMYKDWKYILDWKSLSSDELINFYEQLVNKYPIYSIEDWLQEDDWEWWTKLNKRLWDKVMTVGDDLLVTNRKRLEIWIEKNACNAVLVKINQIGSITETIETVWLAYEKWMNCVISHRSWETEDTSIADLAVWLWARFIKTWSISRWERICKYNQLLRIEEKLWNEAEYKQWL